MPMTSRLSLSEKRSCKGAWEHPAESPLVIRNAVNETAKDARKVMIQEAKKRYALNSKGRRHLNDLQIRQKARVSTSAQNCISADRRRKTDAQ